MLGEFRFTAPFIFQGKKGSAVAAEVRRSCIFESHGYGPELAPSI